MKRYINKYGTTTVNLSSETELSAVSNYYYLLPYLLTAVEFSLVQTKQIRINIHKRNNTKTQYKNRKHSTKNTKTQYKQYKTQYKQYKTQYKQYKTQYKQYETRYKQYKTQYKQYKNTVQTI